MRKCENLPAGRQVWKWSTHIEEILARKEFKIYNSKFKIIQNGNVKTRR
jgi:hypothetical protein